MQFIKCNLENNRIETGPLQINEDWPGLFIRGDNAFGLMLEIDNCLKLLNEKDLKKENIELIKLKLENFKILFSKPMI